MTDKSPEEELADMRARLAISQRYLARDDNPDLQPFRQDQLDKNRVPGEFGGEQLSPNSDNVAAEAPRQRTDESTGSGSRPSGALSIARTEAPRENRYVLLALAAFLGFSAGVIWRS